jgi:tRNA(fMet)-specific endonuclease VapC
MKYLLDTDWVIDHLHNVERVVRRLEELAPEGVGLSIISLAELYEGVFNSTDPQGNERGLQDFLVGVSVVEVDEETCRMFGRERGRLRREGRRIPDFDLLIAATCRRHGLTLLTNNRRHFVLVDDLTIISV